jgi:hypothetical protein
MLRRWTIRAALLMGSLSISLAFAELAATLHARGAYPYLNLFIPDRELGVVLEPRATTRVRSKLGRITRIDTDEQGRRVHPTGAGPKRVLLLGDSQAFGYLVDGGDAISAELGEITGAEVIDAAVPSYGPHEYVHVAKRLVPELRPDLVVFVANVANDWWEANADNTRRSTARDGWLVSRAVQPEPPLDFPGRRFLLGRSHLVLAARRVAAHAASTFDPAVPIRLLSDLDRLAASRDGHRSRITPFLLSTQRVAEAHGAKLIAVALPLDVMVSQHEWRKYALPPRDLSPLGELLTDFIEDARERGIPAVDLRPVLGPGSFLDDDPHLSPEGHRIFARAIAGEMS